LADAGWTAIPNIVLEKQKALGLTPTDINVILHIAKHWWEAGAQPYPAVGTIAKAIGVQPRTVQRSITKMVDLGLLERQPRYYAQGGQKSNCYSFQGLIDQARPFAEELLEQRDAKKRQEQARRRRDKPLHSVK
jgi:predicted transcriptional regulator